MNSQSILRDRLSALSETLDRIVPASSGAAAYIDYPVHRNIGDLLIWLGALRHMQRNHIPIIGYYNEYNCRANLRKYRDKFATIYFQGGGNFGDLWPGSQHLREEIIAAYPDKKIVILPQSVHYQDTAELDRACDRLSRHPDLHILLRDKHSLGLLRDRNLANTALCPDMAHALWECIASPASRQAGTLRLFRRDKERGNLPPEVLSRLPEAVDWDAVMTRPIHLLFETSHKIQRRGVRFGNARLAYPTWRLVAHALAGAAIRLIAAHDTIETDRLHASILSLLLGRKVIAHDNSYGKLSSYANCWLRDLPQFEIRNPVHSAIN